MAKIDKEKTQETKNHQEKIPEVKPINIVIYPQPEKQYISREEMENLDSIIMNYCDSSPINKPKGYLEFLDAAVKKGEVYIKSGNLDRAKKAFEILVDLGHTGAMITSYAWLINISYWNNDLGKCEKYIKEMIKKAPEETKNAGKTLLARLSLEEFDMGPKRHRRK